MKSKKKKKKKTVITNTNANKQYTQVKLFIQFKCYLNNLKKLKTNIRKYSLNYFDSISKCRNYRSIIIDHFFK